MKSIEYIMNNPALFTLGSRKVELGIRKVGPVIYWVYEKTQQFNCTPVARGGYFLKRESVEKQFTERFSKLVSKLHKEYEVEEC